MSARVMGQRRSISAVADIIKKRRRLMIGMACGKCLRNDEFIVKLGGNSLARAGIPP
jgi:hypothetical protein